MTMLRHVYTDSDTTEVSVKLKVLKLKVIELKVPVTVC